MKYLKILLLLLPIYSCAPPLGKDLYCDQNFLKHNSNNSIRNQNNIINTSPKEVIYILSVGIKQEERVIAYSIPNQKHKGDLVLGIVDKNNGKSYINLGNNAVSMFPLIRFDSYSRMITKGNSRSYAKSLSQESVEDWHKFSYINGNKKRRYACFMTQEKWNQKYNIKNNQLLKSGTKKVNMIDSNNKIIITRGDLGGF